MEILIWYAQVLNNFNCSIVEVPHNITFFNPGAIRFHVEGILHENLMVDLFPETVMLIGHQDPVT